MTDFDKRLTPVRDDLAANHLRGQIEAPRYAEGTVMACQLGKTWIRRRPEADAPVETELLFGETFTVYDQAAGFAWGQAGLDGYVGYVQAQALAPASASPSPTRRVAASSTFVFARPEVKAPVRAVLPFNARVAAGEGTYAPLENGEGFVFTPHLVPLSDTVVDWVGVAERFIGVPYLWGGRTPLGFDCSGLIQASLLAAGRTALRDTDMQEASLGQPIDPALTALQRGDIVFWKGHVGVLRDAETLLHANAHHLAVTSEPFAEAKTRIEAAGSPVTSIRRL